MGKRKQDFPQKNVAVKKYKAAYSGGGRSLMTAKKAALAKKFGARYEKSPETKFIGTQAGPTPISFAGQVLLINSSVEGSAYNQRVGQKIEMTSISVDVQICAGTMTTGQGFPIGGIDAVKVALVYDRQPNGAALAYSDVFNDSASIEAPFGKRNVNNLERFEVLKAANLKIDTASNLMDECHWYIPCHHEVRYNGTNNGNITDIATGSLYLIFADQGSVTTGAPVQYITDTRVRYHDM